MQDEGVEGVQNESVERMQDEDVEGMLDEGVTQASFGPRCQGELATSHSLELFGQS